MGPAFALLCMWMGILVGTLGVMGVIGVVPDGMDLRVLSSVMLQVLALAAVCARSLAGVCVIMRALMWRRGALSVLPGNMVRTARWRVLRRLTAMDVACAVRRMGSACVGVGLLGIRVVSVRTVATRWL